jgi:2-amino-4-hydroxy-6-hydroxymethyldihydropteridine diphosphokinase
MSCADDVVAFVALGANLGDGAAALRAAVQAIDALPLVRVVARSSLYRTAPQQSSGPDYWNAVIKLQTAQSPDALLDALLRIESNMGRERPSGAVNAPRTLDLDLLMYGTLHRQTPELTLPHPRMVQRAFVLAPLAEVWPEGTLEGVAAAELAARRIAEGQRIERLGPL